MSNTVKKEVEKYLDLKVYKNKKNGQGLVILPKKKNGPVPKTVKVLRW